MRLQLSILLQLDALLHSLNETLPLTKKKHIKGTKRRQAVFNGLLVEDVIPLLRVRANSEISFIVV